MHTFYLDKKNTFECQIDIEGASITDSKARLVLENKDGMKFLFDGTLNSEGDCDIPIDNLKSYLKEEDNGSITLEVIVEDTVFSPYESNFNIDVSKKVKVSEIKETDKKSIKENNQPKISVKVKTQPKEDIFETHIKDFITFNKKVKNSSKEKYNFDTVLEYYLNKKVKNQEILTEVKTTLKKLK